MTNEDRDNRKTDIGRTGITNVAIPMSIFKRPGGSSHLSTSLGSSLPDEGIQDTGHGSEVQFKFLVKKGNKQKAVDIPIPQDTPLASQYLKVKHKQAVQQEVMSQFVCISVELIFQGDEAQSVRI